MVIDTWTEGHTDTRVRLRKNNLYLNYANCLIFSIMFCIIVIEAFPMTGKYRRDGVRKRNSLIFEKRKILTRLAGSVKRMQGPGRKEEKRGYGNKAGGDAAGV